MLSLEGSTEISASRGTREPAFVTTSPPTRTAALKTRACARVRLCASPLSTSKASSRNEFFGAAPLENAGTNFVPLTAPAGPLMAPVADEEYQLLETRDIAVYPRERREGLLGSLVGLLFGAA